jgi:Zn-dependent protease with chaperone function
VWLVYLLAQLPLTISVIYPAFASIGNVGMAAGGGGAAYAMVWGFTIIFAVLLYVMLVAGMVVVVFPQVRGRWVERRLMLVADDRPVVAEMQQFVDFYDPSVRLRVSLRADQMARIYPVGWRKARIAVFRPLTVLWRYDREAAQAVLLHEVAHRRRGDQLIMGLGSPFTWLVRIGVPAYLVLVLIPSAVFLVAGAGEMGSFTAGLAASLAGTIPSLVFLPVIALWLAELDADQQAVRAVGPAALRRALQVAAGPRAHVAARAMALLSHPPGRLRLRCAGASPAGSAVLMAAWPASMAVFVLVLPFVIDVPLYFSGQLQAGLWEVDVRSVMYLMLVYHLPLVIATAVVLLAWPAVAAFWERLWCRGPRTGGRQPWWPSLAAASVPVGMLLLFLAPLQVSQQQFLQAGASQGSSGGCSAAEDWVLGGGEEKSGPVMERYDVVTVTAEAGKPAVAVGVRQLDTAIRTALAYPPPGSARPVFIRSMTEYRIAGQDIVAGDTSAGENEGSAASNLYAEALGMISAAISSPGACG